MHNQTIIKVLQVLFKEDNIDIIIQDKYDLYNVGIAQLFLDKYGIVIGYDHLPNVDMYLPYCRTVNYKPKNAMHMKGYNEHMVEMTKKLYHLQGNIKDCYLESIVIAILYLIIKCNGVIHIPARQQKDNHCLAIAKILDMFDNPIDKQLSIDSYIERLDIPDLSNAFNEY